MRIKHMLQALILSISTAASSAEQGSCYPADIEAPPLSRATVAVVNETAFRDTAPARDFRATLVKAASIPGQRVVILTFAGIARGQHLARVYDATIEAPVTDEETVANARIGPFKASQRCVNQRLREHVTKLTLTLDGILMTPLVPTLQRSEIVHFLHQVLADFDTGLPTTVLVYSDGLQHSREMSFYTNGKPRRISADAELKIVRTLGLDASVRVDGKSRAQVLWFGLLATEDPKQYADAQQIGELIRFWRSTLAFWGVTSVQIGPTLNNPKF